MNTNTLAKLKEISESKPAKCQLTHVLFARGIVDTMKNNPLQYSSVEIDMIVWWVSAPTVVNVRGKPKPVTTVLLSENTTQNADEKDVMIKTTASIISTHGNNKRVYGEYFIECSIWGTSLTNVIPGNRIIFSVPSIKYGPSGPTCNVNWDAITVHDQ